MLVTKMSLFSYHIYNVKYILFTPYNFNIVPSHLTSHYKKEENELEISWKRPRFKKNCNLTYHYELKIDGENPTILGNTTDGAITYVPTKCVNYSISVRTKINNVVQSHQPGNHSGRITYLQGNNNSMKLKNHIAYGL